MEGESTVRIPLEEYVQLLEYRQKFDALIRMMDALPPERVSPEQFRDVFFIATGFEI